MNAVIPLIAGFVAGAAGAMGLGGGFVLILYLSWAGMAPADARAANLLFFIPTALMSVLLNRKSGLIDMSCVPYAAAAGSVGAVIGLIISGAADGGLLRGIFAVMLILVGARELFHKKTAGNVLREY